MAATAPKMLMALDLCRIALKSRDQTPAEAQLLAAIREITAEARGEIAPAEGWKLVPIKMTAAMLAASKNAMRDYINRAPPEHRRQLGTRNGVSEDVKHQIRWAAAVAAGPVVTN